MCSSDLYHYTDKHHLIAAALRRIGELDLALVEPLKADPEAALQHALRRVLSPEFLTTEYLSLRLQLWSLAQVDPLFAAINADAQEDYRKGLAALIRAARPALTAADCKRRAADIDVIQNGVWLTSLLGLDRTSIRRNLAHCEAIAFAN